MPQNPNQMREIMRETRRTIREIGVGRSIALSGPQGEGSYSEAATVNPDGTIKRFARFDEGDGFDIGVFA